MQLSRTGGVYSIGLMIENFMSVMIFGRRNDEHNELGLASGFDPAKNGTPARSTHRFASTTKVKITLMR